jgi:DNA polymerase elongation subunit (family B)
MKTLDYNTVIDMVKAGDLLPCQFYNLDIEYHQYFSTELYLNNPDDNIERNIDISVLYLDIECFCNFQGDDIFDCLNKHDAKYPISCCSFVFKDNIYGYFLNNKNTINLDIDGWKEDFLEEIRKQNDSINNLFLFQYNDEKQLIQDVWEKIHELDPAILSGFNSDGFDYPYFYWRIEKLFGESSAKKIMSKFGSITIRKIHNNEYLRIAEYPICDIQYLYKPRDEGGLNLGEKLPGYSLDIVAHHITGFKKVEHDTQSLDQLYFENPKKYLLYNLIDSNLPKLIDNKVNLISRHNMFRTMMQTSFNASLRGSSALYDTMVLYRLKRRGYYIRFNINREGFQTIESNIIKQIPTPKTKITIKKVNKIDYNQIKNMIFTFPGAYVKQPIPMLLEDKNNVTITLDATSLYPSMILQQNIGFDSFFGYVIDPICYKSMEFYINCIKSKKIPPQFYYSLSESCYKWAKKQDRQKSISERLIESYYTIAGLSVKAINKNIDINNLFQPKTYYEYLFVKYNFLVFLDLIQIIHPNYREYNSFVYDWLINREVRTDYIYIVQNYNNPNLTILKLDAKEFDNFLKNNQLIITLSGAIFYRHDRLQSLFYNFLSESKRLRDQYKAARKKAEYGSYEYFINDIRQGSVKVGMNTSYGLYGLSTFRYSNKYLANAITTQGRLMLKIAQEIGDKYLRNLR